MQFPIGRLNGIHAEVGTILGPGTTSELLVVVDNDERGVKVSYCTVPDLEAAAKMDPRSVTEHRHRVQRQGPQ